LLIPDNSSFAKVFNKGPTSPENISVCGNYLLTAATEIQTCDIDSQNGENKDATFIQRLYHEKTYAILSVRRTDGSYGSFNELYSSFDKAGYGAQIDSLSTTRDQSLTKSKEAADLALQSVNRAITFERTKKQLSKLANEALYNSNTVDDLVNTDADKDGKPDISAEDGVRLKNIYWEELTLQAAKRLKSKVDSLIKTKPLPSVEGFCDKFVYQVAYEQNYWRITSNAGQSDSTIPNRDIAWSSILLGLSNYLSDNDDTKKYAPVITDNIENLKIIDSDPPNQKPTITCGVVKKDKEVDNPSL
jgi:hypothetical protein